MHSALLFAPHVGNNPIGFVDPTGHCRDEDSDYKCKQQQQGSSGALADTLPASCSNGEYAGCIAAIESDFSNVDILSCSASETVEGCKKWTMKELVLLQRTLAGYQYGLGDLTLVRAEDLEGDAGKTQVFNSGEVRVSISDEAYYSPPTGTSNWEFFRWFGSDKNFQGVIAHEFTHVAVYYDPTLLDKWEKSTATLKISANDSRLGQQYQWNHCADQACVQEELFAMAVASKEYGGFWWNQIIGSQINLP